MFIKHYLPPFKARQLLIWLVGLYAVFLVIKWIWLIPSFVDWRLTSRVTPGMSENQVVTTFHINNSFDIPSAAHCAPASSEAVSRIAVYTAGGVPLFPLPMIVTSTTTFCFDSHNRLIAFQTKRWVDGP